MSFPIKIFVNTYCFVFHVLVLVCLKLRLVQGPDSTAGLNRVNPVATSPLQVSVFVNPPGTGGCGPFLDPTKVDILPPMFGPGPLHRVLRKEIMLFFQGWGAGAKIFWLLGAGAGAGAA